MNYHTKKVCGMQKVPHHKPSILCSIHVGDTISILTSPGKDTSSPISGNLFGWLHSGFKCPSSNTQLHMNLIEIQTHYSPPAVLPSDQGHSDASFPDRETGFLGSGAIR